LLSSLLNEKGYLFVSSTETLSHNGDVLSLMEVDGIFLYRKGFELPIEDRRRIPAESPLKTKHSQQKHEKPAAKKYVVERKKDIINALFDQAIGLAEGKRYDAALKVIEELIKQNPSFVKAFTLKAGILINLKRIEEAEKVCKSAIRIDSLCLEGYLILGLIAKIQQKEDVAINRFKEALYIKSSCWLAHFYMGEIYKAAGEPEAARREYEIVIKLFDKDRHPESGLTFFPLSFSVSQIRHLCSHNLAELKRRRSNYGD